MIGRGEIRPESSLIPSVFAGIAALLALLSAYAGVLASQEQSEVDGEQSVSTENSSSWDSGPAPHQRTRNRFEYCPLFEDRVFLQCCGKRPQRAFAADFMDLTARGPSRR